MNRVVLDNWRGEELLPLCQCHSECQAYYLAGHLSPLKVHLL